MKNFIKSAFTLVALSLLLFSCQKDKEQASNSEEQKAISVESLFERIVAMPVPENSEHVIYIEFTWNKETGQVTSTQIEEKESDFFVLENVAANPNVYYVECKNGTRNRCKDKITCGKLIFDCLSNRGDSSTGKSQVIYVPQASVFYVGNN